jgi:hypothetical protein
VSAGGSVTRVGMAPRAAGLTFETAQEIWRTEHGDLASGIPGLQGYVQNHAVLRNGAPLLPYAGFDACSELEFADFDAMRAGFASDHYQTAVRADETSLIDKSRFMVALTRRRVLAGREPPDGAVKLMSFLRAHPSSTPSALVETLEGRYAEAVKEAEPLRHEILITDPREHEAPLPPCCDAIDILWFRSPDDALAALTGALAQQPGWLLAGVAFGSERLVARPIRQR